MGVVQVFANTASTLANIAKKFKAAFKNSDVAGDAAKIAARNADTQMGFVTSFVGSLKKSGIIDNHDEAFAIMKKMDDLDDGMKAVLDRAQVLMKKADDAADAGGTASLATKAAKKASDAAENAKGLAKKASVKVKNVASAAAEKAKLAGKFCLDNRGACAVAIGATAYAGLWIEGTDRMNKRRRMCRGLCMPTNTDTFHNDDIDFATVGTSQLTFRPIDDPEVLKVFPDITADTVNDHPICAKNSKLGEGDAERGIANLKDCEVLCDTRCDAKHPKYDMFDPVIDVAEKTIDVAVDAVEAVVDKIDDKLGFSDMMKKFWYVILIVVLLAVAGVAIKFWPKPRRPYYAPAPQ